jgi:hypothetical protein
MSDGDADVSNTRQRLLLWADVNSPQSLRKLPGIR